MTKAPGLVADD